MIRTWHIEHAVVAALLFGTVVVTSGGWVEVVGAVAVQASFGHAGIAVRLQEREQLRERPEVDCYRWLGRYFIGKEVAWFIYFVAHQSWSALVGVGVFLAYPVWRHWWRKRHPVNGTVDRIRSTGRAA